MPKAQVDLQNPRGLLVEGYLSLFSVITRLLLLIGIIHWGNISEFIFLEVYESHPVGEKKNSPIITT